MPGVTRAWTVPLGAGAGTVIVYPMFDDNAHGGFPQGTDGVSAAEHRTGAPATATGDQLLVADHIWGPQPVTALVIVCAPLPHPIDVSLVALDPNTEDIREGVEASLRDLFLLSGEVAGTLYPSQFYEAVLATPGIRTFTMTVPAGPVTAPGGALPVLGQFTAPGGGRGARRCLICRLLAPPITWRSFSGFCRAAGFGIAGGAGAGRRSAYPHADLVAAACPA